jgi:hypothetical protein
MGSNLLTSTKPVRADQGEETINAETVRIRVGNPHALRLRLALDAYEGTLPVGSSRGAHRRNDRLRPDTGDQNLLDPFKLLPACEHIDRERTRVTGNAHRAEGLPLEAAPLQAGIADVDQYDHRTRRKRVNAYARSVSPS